MYLKIPRQKKPNENDTHKSKENGTSACLQLRSSYALLLEPESETPLPVSDRKEQREKKDMKEKRSKTRRRRKDREDQSASDEEDNGIRKRHRPEYEEEPREKHAAWTEGDKLEAMKRRDEQERDEFAERMRAKDKAASNSRNHQNHVNPAPPIEDVQSRRLKSREDYLAKRQVRELELLKKQIEIDQEMWSTERLTRREMREIRHRAETYRIALERQNIDNGDDGYVMPDQYFTRKAKSIRSDCRKSSPNVPTTHSRRSTPRILSNGKNDKRD